MYTLRTAAGWILALLGIASLIFAFQVDLAVFFVPSMTILGLAGWIFYSNLKDGITR